MTEASPNPYVGPRTFTREEGERFFGREREARDLLARVISERLVLFYAQSGAGKSSLINTRLIPQLQAAGYGVLPVGRVSGALPTGVSAVNNIFAFNLCLSLDQSQGDPERFSHMPLSHFLARLTSPDGERYYYQAESEVESADYEVAPSILIIDQFEEIVTTHPEHWPQRADFFRQLDQAMVADPLLWVVLTLREDYIAALEPYAYLLTDKLRARFYMQRMGYEAALEAVEQPARLGGRPFADDVAQTLVDNLRQIRVQPQFMPSADGLSVAPPEEGGQPPATQAELAQRGPLALERGGGRTLGQYIEPVQLQVVCYQLWENLQNRAADLTGFSSQITAADLEILGNVDTALAKFYEQALQKTLVGLTPPPPLPRSGEGEEMLPLSAQDDRREGLGSEVSENQLRTWFDQKLITEAGTRGTVYQGPHETAGLPNLVVNALADQFLLRAEIRAGGTWYELVHDRFIEPIQQSNRAWREQQLRQNPLLQAAQSWLDSGRDPAKLYQGQQLQNAQAGLDRAGLEPLAQEFLEASEEVQRRRDLAAATQQARLLRNTVGVLGLVLFVVIGAAIFAWRQRQEAEAQRQIAEDQRLIIRANQLAAQSQIDWRDGLPQRSLLMALEALSVTQAQNEQQPVPAAEQALRDALQHAEGRGLSGHEDTITAVAFSPDGRWLVTGSSDSTARLWDMQQLTAEPVVLRGHEDAITAVAFSPECASPPEGCRRWLVTGSEDSTARLWDMQQPTAEPVVLQGHELFIAAVAFSPDGRWLVTGSYDSTVRLWDLQQLSAEPVVLRGHEDAVTAVAFSPECASPPQGCGRWLVTGSGDNTARLWDMQQPTAEPVTLRGHENFVTAIAFSPDGRWLVTGSEDTTARVWDMRQPTAEPVVLQNQESINSVRNFSLGLEDFTTTVAFSPECASPPEGCGRWLVTSSGDKTARLWDMQQLTAEPVVLQGHQGIITAVAFSPEGRWLVTGSEDTTARLWDMQQPTAEPVTLRGHEDAVTAVAFSPECASPSEGCGRWLVTGSWDKTARLWDRQQPTAEPVVLRGHEDSVTAVAFSPECASPPQGCGRWLVTGSEDKTIRLWDMQQLTAEPVILRGHERTISAVAFSPECASPSEGCRRWLATGSFDNTARLWDMQQLTAEPVILRGHESTISAVAFSPECASPSEGCGRWLVTGSYDTTARLWDLQQLSAEPVLLQTHKGSISAVAFSPDGHWLVVGSWDDTVRLWDMQQPAAEPVMLRGFEGYIYAVAFSPDGRWLVTGSGDGVARLWDMQQPTAEPVALQGHEAAIIAVAFSPECASPPEGCRRWLVTGSEDQTARLWDMQQLSAEPVVLHGHKGNIFAVAFSPDGRWLVTGSGDNTARLWQMDLAELTRLACIMAGRNLSAAEWERFFPDQTYHKTCPDLPSP